MLQQSLAERGRDESVLQRREQEVQEGMDGLSALRAAAEEEALALRGQLRACHEAGAKASRQQRELALEASQVKARLAEARQLWEAQAGSGVGRHVAEVHMRRASLRASETELSALKERLEGQQVAKMEGQRLTAELHGKLAAVRTEYGQLLTWQQQPQSLEEHLDFQVSSWQGEIRSRGPF